ncbi:hypothetical protein CTEN210_03801 [Chaetoceros tenuissimus]|uniref:Uncharacterized protein n=1 Tax=Chaetoceros tenuissimus TaxID=426638 RepID=A0AAD3H1Y7_9STRA|nr:hypothetical protein CTEN210_03801 [Chaetoceros tenuissimus]
MNRRFTSRSKIVLALLALWSAVAPASGAMYYGGDSNSTDDNYVDLSNEDFDSISVMPISCVNYMNGHMIKFEMYEKSNNFQCHTNNVGTFVVSISHYMRAYFNYQALLRGENFKLPSDAGYLNCVLLQQTAYSDTKLYAKIGCLEKDSYTSTKLQLHVYTDKQCSVPYDDGQDSSKYRKGYNINGYYFSSKVSFRPPFYSCMNCKPETIADSFSKRKTFWYDDDAAANGYQIYKYFDDWLDDYFLNDDAYFKVQEYTNNEVVYTRDDDDNFYTIDDDDNTATKKSWWSHRDLKQIEGQKLEENVVTEKKEVSRNLMGSNQKEFEAKVGALENYEKDFWMEHAQIRELGNGNSNSYNDDSVKSWNMCEKVYKYGVWCDEDCRAIDAFRIDEWSTSDLFLLTFMCVFMAFMMLLVFAKRVKAYEKASIYGDEAVKEVGMAPSIMAGFFVVIFLIVVILAVLRFVNETLVFAVVSCILLFIYMLKLTLFEPKSPALLNGSGKRRKKSRKDPYAHGDDFRYHGDTDNPLFKY